jgi:hypothetical protein
LSVELRLHLLHSGQLVAQVCGVAVVNTHGRNVVNGHGCGRDGIGEFHVVDYIEHTFDLEGKFEDISDSSCLPFWVAISA